MAADVEPDLEKLLRLARVGDNAALGELLELYRNYLTLLARLQIGRRLQGKVDASDVVQEAFLTQEDYSRLRKQALSLLRAALMLGRRLFEKEPDKYRQGVKDTMDHWQRDPNFNGVRDQAALAKLPEAERQEWRALWEEVAELGRRAGAK